MNPLPGAADGTAIPQVEDLVISGSESVERSIPDFCRFAIDDSMWVPSKTNRAGWKHLSTCAALKILKGPLVVVTSAVGRS